MLEIQALTYNSLAPVMPVAGTISTSGTIGRNEDNAIILPDPANTVSRQHLQFSLESRGIYRVRNVSKKNPAFIDGQELGPGMECLLRDHAQIIIGAYVLQARYVAQPRKGEPAMPPPPAGAAQPDGVSDDFLASLLGSGPAARRAETALPDAEDENLAALFAEDPRIVRGDPMPMLNERGIDPGSLDGKGDELINGGGDAGAMTRELLRDPLSGQADNSLRRDGGLDPLEALFGGGGGEFDDILQGGKSASAALNVARMDLTHGPELGGLFHLPEAGGKPASGDPPPEIAPAPVSPALPPDVTGMNDEIDRLIAEPGPASGGAVLPGGGAPFPALDDGNIDWLLDGLEPGEAAAADSAPETAGAGSMDEIDRLITGLDGGTPDGNVLPEADRAPETAAAGNGISAPIHDDDIGGPPAWPDSGAALRSSASTAPDARPVAVCAEEPPPARPPRTSPARTPLEADTRELYAAFIEGLGVELPDRTALDKDFMKMLGQLFRGYVQGTVDMIASRAIVKQAVRANVTVIAPEDNNPLKFSPDGKVALLYLLGKPFPGFMGPVEAVRNAFADLRAHQIGIVSGTKSALNHVLDRFDPRLIDEGEAERGLDNVLPRRRKARLWDAYIRHFQDARQRAADHFQAFFGAAFLEAYEKAIAAIQPEERRHKP
ncbi:MAG: type VI secretion system-associated FHA domain protein TagH [Azoarcus sp.]|nr:type VI secretion system-associated FHA domain protein TagH [Azoarcus sp.]